MPTPNKAAQSKKGNDNAKKGRVASAAQRSDQAENAAANPILSNGPSNGDEEPLVQTGELDSTVSSAVRFSWSSRSKVCMAGEKKIRKSEPKGSSRGSQK